ncbi:MAG: extracellular solute-binding protein, partial [Clostridia bacterium]|nr:extracellular solute-binding protein [Clostridia bacterium]
MTRKILALALALMMLSAAALADVPAYEDIVFPDVLPSGIVFPDDTFDYSYDDMTTKYDLSIIVENYGVPNSDNEYDPIAFWLNEKFNLNISYSAVDELGDVLPALAAADDLPDLFMPPSNSRDWAFQLDDAGKLIDATTIYPYMPLSQKYVTTAMLANSTNPETGRMPFITGYGIQDGVWTNAIRKDWLDKFGMDYPKNVDDVRAYAEAVKTQDPDGNGVDDTYIFGIWRTMYSWCENAYGNAAPHVDENGELSHMYFNGVRYGMLQLLKEFNDAGYLHPDWAITDWNTQKVMTAQDKLGALYYPVGTLMGEYRQARGSQGEDDINVWEVCQQYPFGDGEILYPAAGNPGYRWCFPVYGYEEEGKLLRVAHMIDTMRAGGENFFQCIQNGTDDMYQFYADNHEGVTKNPNYIRDAYYTDDGYFCIYSKDLTPDDQNDNMSLLGNAFMESYDGGPWQQWGLPVAWQLSNADPEDPNYAAAVKSNEHAAHTASVSR